MSTYQLYLYILNQLSQRNSAKFELGDKEILIQKSNKKWIFSTVVFQSDFLPPEIEEYVLASTRYPLGSFLKCDPELSSVQLIQETPAVETFVQFKSFITALRQKADECSSNLL